jgi:hypothetical protein
MATTDQPTRLQLAWRMTRNLIILPLAAIWLFAGGVWALKSLGLIG